MAGSGLNHDLFLTNSEVRQTIRGFINGAKPPAIGEPAPPLAIASLLQAPAEAKADWNALRGKVTVLEFWATWCGPCVEEFPSLVKLYDRYNSRGLVVLAAAMDEPQTRGQVQPFLVSQKASFPAFIRKSGDVEAFVSVIDKNWGGAVPTTYVFDRSGKLAGKPLVGAQTYEKFAATVEPLLK